MNIKLKKIKNKIKIALFSFFLLPIFTLGETVIELSPLDAGTLEDLIGDILRGLTFILTPIIVLAFVYSGFLFLKAQGNSSELTKAKEAFGAVIIGAILILGANLIFTVISTTITNVL